MPTSPQKTEPQASAKDTVIRLAIVEDDAGYRETLKTIFSNARGFIVTAAYPNAELALKKLPDAGCDLILMDINLPGRSGIECLRSLKAQMTGLRVVMLTAYNDTEKLFQSLVAGADGYLLKRITRDRLIEALRDIVDGGAPISPQIARQMVEYFRQSNSRAKPVATGADNPHLSELTPRENQVLKLIANGCTPKEVAAELDISWQTVRNHIRFIYDKLHVHTRAEALRKYWSSNPAP